MKPTETILEDSLKYRHQLRSKKKTLENESLDCLLHPPNSLCYSAQVFQALISPFVLLSCEVIGFASLSSGNILLASALPSSTPHWSKLYMFHMAPCTKIFSNPFITDQAVKELIFHDHLLLISYQNATSIILAPCSSVPCTAAQPAQSFLW